jgi:hypothetical protein
MVVASFEVISQHMLKVIEKNYVYTHPKQNTSSLERNLNLEPPK